MKICFLGMSGVRSENKELLEMGLTLPGFIERSKQIASLPHLGLLTLAGMTPEEEFEISYEEREKFNENDPLFEEEFDLVAISALSAQIFEGYKVAEKFKKLNIKTIMGGLHITSTKEEALQYCNSVVIGEGELAWPFVLEDLQNNSLKRIYDFSNQSFDFKNSPMPMYKLLDPNKYNRITVQTQRGCTHHCEFCASSILLSSHFKEKPVDKVISEIVEIKKLWKNPFIEFADDNSFVNHHYSKKLLNEIIKLDIKWFSETDLSIAEDDELLELMHQSGCHQLLIGLESPTKEGLYDLEMNSNWKYEQFENYKKSIQKIQSYGITVNGCFIVGMDSQTKDVFDEIYNFVDESKLYEVQVTLLTPFPNTPLYDRLLKEGRIIKPNAWELCTLFDINFIPKNMSVGELQNGFLELVQKLYSKEFTRRRKKNFLDIIRNK